MKTAAELAVKNRKLRAQLAELREAAEAVVFDWDYRGGITVKIIEANRSALRAALARKGE
jgi:hypothetical protein